ncbi:MAG: hypothetical protein HQK98_00840 [Nitrospirae bacterium]|nr:hypothetical protein [Nitrospirota bacterium]
MIAAHHLDVENNAALEDELKEQGIFYEEILIMLADLLSTQGEEYDKSEGDARMAWVKTKLNVNNHMYSSVSKYG